MSDSSDRNPVEALAEEFLERFRRGERPALSEYTRQYPELASEIRDLFPALVMLEDVRPSFGPGGGPPSAAAAAEGKTLERLGDYRILREVGRGGMGVVYEAEQESLGRHVALKVLPGQALLEPQQLLRFQREARAAARLHHTNIVPVFGVGEAEGRHYYVMQFIQGQGLDQVIHELRRLRRGLDQGSTQVEASLPPAGAPPEEPAPIADPNEAVSALAVARSLLTGVFASPALYVEEDRTTRSPVTPSPPHPVTPSPEPEGRPYWHRVAGIGIQVAEALAYAHSQGTLHRDIKPSNLLLDTQGIVWVTDFGLAKAQDSEDLTRTGDIVGTLRYLAPERFQGQGDGRSDLYALGLTLYELLTLRPAFSEVERAKLLHQVIHQEPIRPRKLNPAVPRDLETIVLKAIARDPAHRYANATELAEDLKRFQDDKPIHARRVSESEKVWRLCRRHPGVAGLAAAFVLTLLLGIIGTSWKWREADAQRRQVLEAKQETDHQRDQAIRARNASQRLLAENMLERGITLAEQGEIGEGLCWMLEALPIAEERQGEAPVAADLAQLIRLNLAGWRRQNHGLYQLAEFKESICWCAFPGDGQRLVTGSPSGVQSWDAATGRPLGPPLPLKDTLALSPDGTILLAKTEPGGRQPARLLRRDARTGQAIGPPLDHPRPILTAVFSPDGKQIATGCKDGTVRRWDSGTGARLPDLLTQDQLWVRSLAFHPGGQMLAAGTAIPEKGEAPSGVYLWDLNSGKQLGPLPGHQSGIVTVAFSPDGKKVASGGWDGLVLTWDTTTGRPIGAPLAHPRTVFKVGFTPDGRTIVTGGHDGLVRWWDSGTGLQLSGTLPLRKANLNDLALRPDGRMLVVALGWPGGGGEVCLFRLARDLSRPAPRSKEGTLRVLGNLADGVSWFQWHLASYSPDRRRVVIGSGEGLARLCDTITGQPASLGNLGRPLRHAWPCVDVTAYSPDGRFFATASRDRTAVGEARLWDAATGRLIGVLPHSNYVAAMAFSPDGKLLATGGYDRAVHFWDPATGQRVGPSLLQVDIVLGLAFSPDGKTLGVGHARDYSGALGIVLWDVPSRKQLGQAPTVPGFLLAFRPDGKWLLAAGETSLTVLDALTCQPLWPSISEPGGINSACWSQDGRHILLATTEGTVRLRDAATGKPAGAAMLHPVGANVAVFSPDPEGRLILAGYADGSARLLDRALQKPFGPPLVQNRPIRAVAFLPDGQSLVTTAEDGTTRHWPLPAAVTEPVERLRLRLQVETRLEMTEGQIVQLLDPAEWEQRRRLLAEQQTESTDAVSEARFHDARARDAEQDGDPFAARWHLDRLLALEPEDWLTWARRARAWTDANQLEQAEADYSRARQRGSVDHLLCWYRHCIVAGQAARRWPNVLWYLNRALALAPDDWHLYADRALAYEKLGKGKEQETDAEEAVARGADSTFLVHLADHHARQGHWDRAAAAFATAHERGPLPQSAWHCQALVCLKRGDPTGYREICRRLLQEVGQAPHPGLAHSAAWICAVGPNAVSDYTQPLALAERALGMAPPKARPDILNTLGALHYRAGRFQKAAARLKESIQARDGEGQVHDWIFLAMTLNRLGETDQARQFLARVAQHQSPGSDQPWSALEVELLHKEASSGIRHGPGGYCDSES